MASDNNQRNESWPRQERRDERNRHQRKLFDKVNDNRTRKKGYLIIFAFIAVLIGWGYLAPLQSAALAMGTVNVDGNKRVIQHSDGGTVLKILVSDGDKVKVGDTVFMLDTSDLETHFLSEKHQSLRLASTLARWRAASTKKDIQIVSPEQIRNILELYMDTELCAAQENAECIFSEKEINRATMQQNDILTANFSAHINTLKSTIYQIKQAVQSREENSLTHENLKAKFSLVRRELTRVRSLRDRGLVTRERVFKLESDLVDARQYMDQASMSNKVLSGRISQLKSDQNVLQLDWTQNALESAIETENQLNESSARLKLLISRLDNANVVSPVDGTIINSQLNTIGSVVEPGATLMEIVPSNIDLKIDTQVSPADRDSVIVGQQAEVRFSAYDVRSSAPVTGTVTYISADRLIDPVTNKAYYRTLIELQDDVSEALNGGQIYPGMQADVMISTGEQTFIDYLLSPIARSFSRALKES